MKALRAFIDDTGSVYGLRVAEVTDAGTVIISAEGQAVLALRGETSLYRFASQEEALAFFRRQGSLEPVWIPQPRALRAGEALAEDVVDVAAAGGRSGTGAAPVTPPDSAGAPTPAVPGGTSGKPSASPAPKLPPYDPKKKNTIGEFRGPDGTSRTLLPGWNGPAKDLPREVLSAKGGGWDIVTRTHVEGHAAALMHQRGLREATVYINNPEICPSCQKLLPRMLPPGSRLTVVLPDGTRVPFRGR